MHSFKCSPKLSLGIFTSRLKIRLRTLFCPVNPTTLAPLRITAAAGVVSRGFLIWYRHYRPRKQGFTIRKPSSPTTALLRQGFPSIAQYSPLLPPVGVWTVSQFQCGRSPLRSATHRCRAITLPTS